MLDILLIIIGVILLIVGALGCVIPGIPGPPLSYAGLLLLHFTERCQFNTEFLALWAVIAIAVTILDNFIPVWSTQKYGGSKKAVWGSVIGLLFGLFIFPPWGIVFCPFIGAVVGELIEGKETRLALKSGFGAFIGLLGGTLMKLIVSGFMTFYFFSELL